MTAARFRWLVAAAFAIGLAIRIASVVTRPHLAPGGDPFEYLGQANLLVEGKGWIEPIFYHQSGAMDQTAKLPPLYTMLLALCSLAGFKSFFAHRIWSALISSAGVPLGARLGRDVAGRGVGVLTAFGVALYPNLWMSAGLGMSETVSPLLVMVVLILAYRMWRQPTVALAAVLGVSIGFAALARDELLVFVVLILLPLAWGARRSGRPWRQRIRLMGAGTVAALAVIAPWVGFNLVRFQHPVFITDRFGVTLASANCPAAWDGPFAGYWSMPCAAASVRGVRGDESADDPVATEAGLRYVESHLSGLPRIDYDRLGRTFGFYRVSQQMSLDINVEGRPRTWAWVGLWAYYALAAAAPVGMIVLRRRGIPLFPLAAVAADVLIVVLLTYGQTRFRATLEPVLVLLGAVTAVSCRGYWRAHRASGGRSRPRSAGSPEPEPLSASAV